MSDRSNVDFESTNGVEDDEDEDVVYEYDDDDNEDDDCAWEDDS